MASLSEGFSAGFMDRMHRPGNRGVEMTDEPLFLDCEASSLHSRDSYPIEVAWGRSGGEIESHLINPYRYPAHWRDWDPAAQALHGLSRAYLRQHGEPPEHVAHRIEAALPGRAVYSDAAAFDNFWLGRLFEAVGRDCPVACRPIDALLQALFPRGQGIFYFDPETMTYATLEKLCVQARIRCGKAPHRAANDVAYLRTVYALALERA